MTDTRHHDERVERTPEEQAALLAARKKAEADAEQADERARIQTLGGAAFGILGFIVTGVALLWQENIVIGIVGFAIGAVGFGMITAAQGVGLLGRGGSS